MSRTKSRVTIARWSMYLYASRLVKSTSNYRISITAKPIEFLIGLIDSLGFNYIKKVSLLLLYVYYKQKYYDVKSHNVDIFLFPFLYFLKHISVITLDQTYFYNFQRKIALLMDKLANNLCKI